MKLTSGLRQMDRESTFTRFMELSPELRVTVYEYLLIDSRTRDGDEAEEKEADWRTSKEDFQIHLAVLRTSKLIYSEAQPILYKKNKFGVKIGYSYPEARPAGNTECDLRILRPGHRFPFFQRAAESRHTPAIQHLFESPVSSMLCILEHLNIDLGLVTASGSVGNYTVKARQKIANLCLVLLDSSNLKALTSKVNFESNNTSNANLAQIFWPLVLLQAGVNIRIEGIGAVLRIEALLRGEYREVQKASLGTDAQTIFGKLVARARRIATSELRRESVRRERLVALENVL